MSSEPSDHKAFLIQSLIKKNTKESQDMVSWQHGTTAPPMYSQHPVQRKHSVILAPFIETTIGYIFPSRSCWLETTDGEAASTDMGLLSPKVND
jgi:hypothetical protein